MDAINIISGIILFLSLTGNMTGAKKGIKSALSTYKEKPKTYLQKLPPNISALVLFLIILGIFGIGTIKVDEKYLNYRIVGLALFAIGSYLQIHSFKALGESYSQEIIIYNKHKLVTSGIYGYIRHPQYLFQVISDLGAAIALGSYLVLLVTVVAEIPLFILRAKLEDTILEKNFKDEYILYKKKAGMFLPKRVK